MKKKILLAIFILKISTINATPNVDGARKAEFPGFCFIASLSYVTHIPQSTLYYMTYGLDACDPIDYPGTTVADAYIMLKKTNCYPLLSGYTEGRVKAKFFADALKDAHTPCVVFSRNEGHATLGISANYIDPLSYSVDYKLFETDYFFGNIITTYEGYNCEYADVWTHS